MNRLSVEFSPQEVAAIEVTKLDLLGRLTISIPHRLGSPGVFNLEGDMEAVAEAINPALAPLLLPEELPAMHGRANADEYEVTARLPSTPWHNPSVPQRAVAELSYRVFRRPRAGKLKTITSRVISASLIYIDRAESDQTPVLAELAASCITGALRRLNKGELPEGARWNFVD